VRCLIASPCVAGFIGEQLASFLSSQFENFLRLDSYGGMTQRTMGLNGYSYVEGNVVNRVDPSGMHSSHDLNMLTRFNSCFVSNPAFLQAKDIFYQDYLPYGCQHGQSAVVMFSSSPGTIVVNFQIASVDSLDVSAALPIDTWDETLIDVCEGDICLFYAEAEVPAPMTRISQVLVSSAIPGATTLTYISHWCTTPFNPLTITGLMANTQLSGDNILNHLTITGLMSNAQVSGGDVLNAITFTGLVNLLSKLFNRE
jgi:hypothetical protein